MRTSFTYFLLFVVFFASDAKSDSSEEGGSRIVGGLISYLGQLPYQVSLRRSDDIHCCGATILSTRWVLTAAHCLVQDPPPVSLVVGNLSRTGAYPKYMISKRIIHPSYKNDSVAFDVGVANTTILMIFNSSVSAAFMPTKPPAVGTTLIASGWGTTTPQGANAADILQYYLPYSLNDAQCSRYYVPPGVMCVFIGRDQGVCSGDSGGPMTANNYTIYGIISHTLRNECAYGIPDGTTNVTYYRTWICTTTQVCKP